VFLPAPFDDCPHGIGKTDCMREARSFGPNTADNSHHHCIRFNVVEWHLSGKDLSSIRTTVLSRGATNVVHLVYCHSKGIAV